MINHVLQFHITYLFKGQTVVNYLLVYCAA